MTPEGRNGGARVTVVAREWPHGGDLGEYGISITPWSNLADFLRAVNVATMLDSLAERWARRSIVTARFRNCAPLLKRNFGRNWIFTVLSLQLSMISIIPYWQYILVSLKSFSMKLWSGLHVETSLLLWKLIAVPHIDWCWLRSGPISRGLCPKTW